MKSETGKVIYSVYRKMTHQASEELAPDVAQLHFASFNHYWLSVQFKLVGAKLTNELVLPTQGNG